MAGEISNEKIYKKGKEYINDLKYDLAIIELRKINGYKDVDSLLEECYERAYELAKTFMERHNFDKAIVIFKLIINYKDSKYKIAECEQLQKEKEIRSECNRICNGLDAVIRDVKSSGNFSVSKQTIYKNGLSLLEGMKRKSDYASQKYNHYVSVLEELRAIEEAHKRRIAEEKRKEQRKEFLKKFIPILIALIIVFLIILAIIIGPQIAKKNRAKKRYNQAVENIENEKYDDAYNLLRDLNYKNSEDLIKLLDARSYLVVNKYEEAIDIVYNLGGTTTVSYDSETGSVDRNSDVIKKQHINNEATATGKEFIGWNVDSYAIDYKKYDLNLSLVAKFESIEFNIVYIDVPTSMEDSFNLPQTYTYDENGAFNIPDVRKKGYTFLGWSLNNEASYKTNYVVARNRLGDISLTAHWQANKYTITLDVNGGPDLAETEFEVTQGESFTLPVPGEREGFTFVGYGYFYERKGTIYNNPITNANGESKNPFTYGENRTIYALWEGEKYNVTIKVSAGGYITIPNSTSSIVDDERIFVGETKVKTIRSGNSITLEKHSLTSTGRWYVDDVYVSSDTTFTFTVQPHDSVIELR